MRPIQFAQHESSMTGPAGAGELNRVVAWLSLAAGAGTGLIMGLWSFDGPVAAPAWIGNYGATPWRLLRLGHIAFFGLGILNLLLVQNLPTFSMGQRATRAVLGCMNFGNVFLPLTLIGAAAFHPLKYLMPFPALSVFVALCLAAGGAWLRFRSSGGGDAGVYRAPREPATNRPWSDE